MANDRPTYESVRPVGTIGELSAESLSREIDEWISAPPIRDLAAAEMGNPTGSLRERLAYLDGLSAAVWDFRGRASSPGVIAERNQVDSVAVRPEREGAVRAAAKALGMVDPGAPRFLEYDYVLTLGGLVRACLWRTQYAGYLIRNRVKSHHVVALTAFRRLARNPTNPSLDEPTLLIEAGAPTRDFEAEVMEDALLDTFSLDSLNVISAGAGHSDADRFKVASGSSDETEVALVAAPDPKSPYRADTATTMRYWASAVAYLRPGQRILNVTSAIYVPFQHAVALQHLSLPYGVVVDTVGIDHTAIRPLPSAQRFTAVNYLQEIRSAIRAYRGLLDAVETPGRTR